MTTKLERRRYVPCPLDPPEEIHNHYREMWNMAIVEELYARRQISFARGVRHKRKLVKDLLRCAERTNHWKSCFQVAEQMVHSYRKQMGNGALVPVESERKDSNKDFPVPPLTCVYNDRSDLGRHSPGRYITFDALPDEIKAKYKREDVCSIVEVFFLYTEHPEYIIYHYQNDNKDYWRFQTAGHPRKHGGKYKLILTREEQ
jgi:hypothetical protein